MAGWFKKVDPREKEAKAAALAWRNYWNNIVDGEVYHVIQPDGKRRIATIKGVAYGPYMDFGPGGVSRHVAKFTLSFLEGDEVVLYGQEEGKAYWRSRWPIKPPDAPAHLDQQKMKDRHTLDRLDAILPTLEILAAPKVVNS